MEAGVVDRLPVSALIGWDNPDLEDEKEGGGSYSRGADPKPIENKIPGAEFADELFSGRRTKKKRETNFRFIQEKKPLEMTAGELQQEDDSLEAVRKSS